MTGDLFISGAKIFSKHGLKDQNILIHEGKAKFVSHYTPSPDVEVIEASGKVILPSFIDMHVHLREPGFSYKETISSGSKAAAAGGFTTVCTMPNLKPSPDDLKNLNVQLDIINKDACINVLPYATITKARSGKELVDYKALAPYVAGFSDDGSGVQSEEIMRKAMKEIASTGKILAAHCEVESLLNGGYIHKGKYASFHNHKGISSESEWKEVERDIRLVRETGCRLHVCHMSTKESVELVRKAKKEGLPVTCETGPHYLTFDDSMLKEDGKFKMNPPIRDIEDRDALREGVIDGTIDVIATDHAPHSFEEKNKGLEKSAMGVVGLETAFSAVYTTMVLSNLMSLERLVQVMAIEPRKILGLKEFDYVKDDCDADLVIVDLNENFHVDPALFFSQGKATPYDNMLLTGTIYMTLINGKPCYKSI